LSLPPLVGRERELATLERHLTGAHGERPVLILAGEPGIGKTRLLREAARRGLSAGLAVLISGGVRDPREPYAALRHLLRGYLREQDAANLHAWLDGCDWLATLLPELAHGEPRALAVDRLPLDGQRDYVEAALARFLSNIAGSAGTLLILDDLHLVDAASLDLLTALARSPRERPARILAAYRDTELAPGSPLDRWLSDQAAAGAASCRTLQPLDAAGARALLLALLAGGEPEPAEAIDRVTELSAGVPFYLVSYAEWLRAGRPEPVPWEIVRAVRGRLAGLPQAGQDMLRRAAVAPLALRDRPVAVLEACCRAGLLRLNQDGAYVFTRDVIRQAILADLSSGERATLSRCTASETGTPMLDGDAGQSDAELAARYLEQAGDRASDLGAWQQAVTAYRDAIERLERTGPSPEAARLRAKLDRRRQERPASIADGS
ncbi:MAG TPA: AAA family ATPase, partial [Nitrolancea sp.]|nr:AAA family ATPase [Nitrolancea sp.]